MKLLRWVISYLLAFVVLYGAVFAAGFPQQPGAELKSEPPKSLTVKCADLQVIKK